MKKREQDQVLMDIDMLTDDMIENLSDKEAGALISLLVHKYMIKYDVSKESIIESISKSVDILEK